MSDRDYTVVAEKYQEINNMAKQLGSTLKAPFMTLSFMALPVIPQLKLTDKGLFDAKQLRFIDVFEQQEIDMRKTTSDTEPVKSSKEVRFCYNNMYRWLRMKTLQPSSSVFSDAVAPRKSFII
jgi:hypothetical protein